MFKNIQRLIEIYAEREIVEIEMFYNKLQQVLNKVKKKVFIMFMGNFNARFGNTKVEQCINRFSEQAHNQNGACLIVAVLYNQLKVMNKFFSYKDSHKFTWNASGSKSIIDYMVCNNKLAELVLDTRVFRGPELETDHYLLVCPI